MLAQRLTNSPGTEVRANRPLTVRAVQARRGLGSLGQFHGASLSKTSSPRSSTRSVARRCWVWFKLRPLSIHRLVFTLVIGHERHIRWRILDEIRPRRKSLTADELRRKIESQGADNVRLFGLNEAVDESPEQEVDQADFFDDATSELNPRQKEIVEAVYLFNDRLADLSRSMDRTRSRLTSLHANCLAAMRRLIVPDAGEAGEAD